MKSVALSLFTFVLGLTLFGSRALATSFESCSVPVKNSSLAMDQRDDLRMTCLKEKRKSLSVTQCLNIAKSMEYSNNAEEARLTCLYDLRQPMSLKECVAITRSMEYPDSGDEARWECLRKFNRTISAKQCRRLARSMSYPPNMQRAEQYCTNELL